MNSGVANSRYLRLAYALCLLGGTSTHVWALVRHGLLWDYGGVPLFTQLFWTSLTFLDPLAALALFIRPRVGLVMTLVIIVVDVVHNVWFGVQGSLGLRVLLNWQIQSQIVFLIFMLVTFQVAWRGVCRPNPTGTI